MRVPGSGWLFGVLVGASVVHTATASAQGDTADHRAWEPAAITQLDLPDTDNAAHAASTTRLTPDALQGPPTPAAMYAITTLDGDQLYQYVAAYRAHMSATWDARYSVASAMRLLNQAVERRDEDAARYYAAIADRLWARLAAEDRGFDLTIETLLRKEQRKHYREWKKRLAKGAAEQGRLEGAPSPG